MNTSTVKKINRTYHILIYSQLTTNITNQSSNCTAFFDFGRLPRSRWRVKYYGAFGTANFTTNILPQIHVDFGQKNVDFGRRVSNEFPANTRVTTICTGNMISYTNQGTACSFNVPATDNGYFYLNETPTSNIFNILVYNLANQSFWTPNMNNALFGFAFEQLDDPIYRSIKNVYNVVFNSDFGQNNDTTNNSLGSKRYFFDWTKLPEGEYQVSTSFHTSTDSSNSISYSSFSIFCDLGQGNSTVFTPSNLSRVNVSSTNFLTTVLCEQSGSIGPLVSYKDYTPPVFLFSRPSNSDVNIYINSTYSGLFPYTRPTVNVMNYTLCFTFRWLGDRNDD